MLDLKFVRENPETTRNLEDHNLDQLKSQEPGIKTSPQDATGQGYRVNAAVVHEGTFLRVSLHGDFADRYSSCNEQPQQKRKVRQPQHLMGDQQSVCE